MIPEDINTRNLNEDMLLDMNAEKKKIIHVIDPA